MIQKAQTNVTMTIVELKGSQRRNFNLLYCSITIGDNLLLSAEKQDLKWIFLNQKLF